MNQTKKRLSIIELAISITDIETINLQIVQLTPLRTDDKINKILSLLESGNYAHAQNLILEYREEEHDIVMQRIPEMEESEPNEDQAIIDKYDFLSESSEEIEEEIESENKEIKEQTTKKTTSVEINKIDIDTMENKHLEKDIKVATQSHDYTTLLDISPDEILAQNIQLDISDKTRKAITKEKTNFDLDTIPQDDFFNAENISEHILHDEEIAPYETEFEEEFKKEKIDFDLDTVPKDDFFNNKTEVVEEPIVMSNNNETDNLFTLIDKEEETHIEPEIIPEEIDIPQIEESTDNQDNDTKEEEIITPPRNTFYPSIPNIYPIFQDIQIKYPSLHKADKYSDMLEVWLEKIADEGYSEAEVEEILKHIEKLAIENKAEAAQFLLLTSRTESKYAKFILARALYRGTLLERNLDESFKIMSYLAFDEKYPEALCDLAQFYENGISIEEDKLQAETLYKEAMDLGIQRARQHYERIQKESKGFFSFLKR